MAYRIFLVDDDKFLLDLYAAKFKNAGDDVTVFPGGEELLAALRKGGEAPTAIMLDIIMPALDGFETVAMLRKEGLAASAKIIFLSNQGQDSDLERAKQLKADGYIVKASAIPSEVLAEVTRIIESKAPAA
jgi:CheY-like chemotaxis protein